MSETYIFEARDNLRTLAGNLQAGEKTKTAITRVAAIVGLSYWRTFDLWYGKARTVADYELQKIRDAKAKKELQRLENDVQNWRISLARADAEIATLRADINRPRLDLLGHEVRRVGRKPRA